MIFFLFFSLLWTSVFHHQNQLSSVSLRRDVGLLNVYLNLHCNDFYLICDILRFCSVLIFESILCSLFRNYLNWLGGFCSDINVNLFILVSMVSFSKVCLSCVLSDVQEKNEYILNATNHGTPAHWNPKNQAMEFKLTPPEEVMTKTYYEFS